MAKPSSLPHPVTLLAQADGQLTCFDLVGWGSAVFTIVRMGLVRGLKAVVGPATDPLTIRQRPR